VTETNVPEGYVDLSDQAQPVSRIVVRGTYLHVPDNSRFVSQRVLARQPVTKSAIFLDRDGVIVEDVHFLKSPAQLRILPGAAQALHILQDKFYIVVVTNQSGVARGLLTEDDLMAIHLELVQRLAVEGVVLDALYYCPHLPEATVQAYQVECDCRKPKPGMLLQAKRDWGLDMAHSFMVGDSSRDIEAGCAAGVKCILLNDGGTALPSTYGLAPDLAGAVRLILAQSSS
jgi:D-glycero-D-manno-heptose 1,7-bisphosphate phosphatase